MAKVVKNISIYSLGNILNKSITFLLVPLYTRVLVPADYGKLELVNTVGAILAMLYGLLVSNGYSRVYFQNKDPEWRKSLFFSGQVFSVLCCIIAGGLSFINAETIADTIFNFPGGAIFLKLVTIVTLFKVLTLIPMNNIRNREKAVLYISINAVYLVINTLLTIYFLVYLKLGVKGVLYAQIISGIVELITLYCFTWNQSSFHFRYSGLITMLSFSIFLIPSNLSSFVLNYSNRYFLNEYMDIKEVGLYSLGAKIAGIIPFLFTEPVKMAFAPYIYSMINNPEKCKKHLADFSRFFFAGLALIALIISFFAKEAITIMADTNYSGSHSIVFILSVSYLFMGLAGIIVSGIHISMKTWIVSLIWVFSAVLNIVLNVLLVPKYGRLGASVATMLSSLCILACYFIAVYKVYPVPFEYFKYAYLSIMMIMSNIIAQYIDKYLQYAFVFKLLLLLTFVISLVMSGYFNSEEKHKAISFIKSHTKKYISKQEFQ